MTYIDKLGEQFDLKNWPHRFTKDGGSVTIGQEEQTRDPIIAQPMICMDCHVKFVSGQTSRPSDPCPARTKKSEMKRLLS
jgi:hypothetical protein